MREADDAADIYRQLFLVDENPEKVATSLIRSMSLLEGGPLEQILFDYVDSHPKDIEVGFYWENPATASRLLKPSKSS